MRPLLRLLVIALLGAGAAACDALLTEPAPAAPEVAVSFAVNAAAGGPEQAFDKVNQVYLVFARPDSARRDTLIRVSPREGVIRTRLVLDARERVSALGIFAQLRRGEAPLFEGQKVVKVEVGRPTAVEIGLDPVAAALRASPPVVTLRQVGDTARLAAVVLFATGDSIPDAAVTWTSLDPQTVRVTDAGLAVARRVGEARIVARHRAVGDTVEVRVLGGRSRR